MKQKDRSLKDIIENFYRQLEESRLTRIFAVLVAVSLVSFAVARNMFFTTFVFGDNPLVTPTSGSIIAEYVFSSWHRGAYGENSPWPLGYLFLYSFTGIASYIGNINLFNFMMNTSFPLSFLSFYLFARKFCQSIWSRIFGATFYIINPVVISYFVAGGFMWALVFLPLSLSFFMDFLEELNKRNMAKAGVFTSLTMWAFPTLSIALFITLLVIAASYLSMNEFSFFKKAFPRLFLFSLIVVTCNMPFIFSTHLYSQSPLYSYDTYSVLGDFRHTYREVTLPNLLRLAGNAGSPQVPLEYNNIQNVGNEIGYIIPIIASASIFWIIKFEKNAHTRSRVIVMLTSAFCMIFFTIFLKFIVNSELSWILENVQLLWTLRNPFKQQIMLLLAVIPLFIYSIEKVSLLCIQALKNRKLKLPVLILALALVSLGITQVYLYNPFAFNGYMGLDKYVGNLQTLLPDETLNIIVKDYSTEESYRGAILPFDHNTELHVQFTNPLLYPGRLGLSSAVTNEINNELKADSNVKNLLDLLGTKYTYVIPPDLRKEAPWGFRIIEPEDFTEVVENLRKGDVEEFLGLEVLFEDHFEDNRSIWETNEGTWQVDSGYLSGETNAFGQRTVVNLTVSDFMAEYKIRWISGSWFEQGFIFRADTSDPSIDCYFVFLSAYDDSVHLYKIDRGVGLLLQTASFEPSNGTWYKIKIVALNRKIQVSIDDELKIEAYDDSFKSGSVGFMSWAGTSERVQYDDLEIMSGFSKFVSDNALPRLYLSRYPVFYSNIETVKLLSESVFYFKPVLFKVNYDGCEKKSLDTSMPSIFGSYTWTTPIQGRYDVKAVIYNDEQVENETMPIYSSLDGKEINRETVTISKDALVNLGRYELEEGSHKFLVSNNETVLYTDQSSEPEKFFENAYENVLYIIDDNITIENAILPSITNYSSFDLDLRFKPEFGTDTHHGPNILFAWTDDNNYFRLIFHKEGYIELAKMENGKYIGGKWVGGANIATNGEFNHLRLIKNRATIILYLNDEHLLTFSDQLMNEEGRIGIGSECSRTCFKDVTIGRNNIAGIWLFPVEETEDIPVTLIEKNPEKYRLEINQTCSSRAMLILGENYDPNWEARMDGSVLANHLEANMYANCWVIDTTQGIHEIEIYYKPSVIYRDLLYISITSVGILLIASYCPTIILRKLLSLLRKIFSRRTSFKEQRQI